MALHTGSLSSICGFCATSSPGDPPGGGGEAKFGNHFSPGNSPSTLDSFDLKKDC